MATTVEKENQKQVETAKEAVHEEETTAMDGKEEEASRSKVEEQCSNDETASSEHQPEPAQSEEAEAPAQAPPASDEEEKDDTSKDTSLVQRPVKRARTAYFIFADEKRPEIQAQHPGEGVATVARELGKIWATLSDEDKQVYQQQAAQERERVAQQLAAWKAAGGVEDDGQKTVASSDGSTLILPLARIRKICKLDPEVRGLSKEALLLITKAAELATAKLAGETRTVAQLQNRRKLLPDDVAQVCATREQFLFLSADVKDLARECNNSKPKATKSSATAASASAAESSVTSKPLTAYFAAKPKDDGA